jgi:hypothetical protein
MSMMGSRITKRERDNGLGEIYMIFGEWINREYTKKGRWEQASEKRGGEIAKQIKGLI